MEPDAAHVEGPFALDAGQCREITAEVPPAGAAVQWTLALERGRAEYCPVWMRDGHEERLSDSDWLDAASASSGVVTVAEGGRVALRVTAEEGKRACQVAAAEMRVFESSVGAVPPAHTAGPDSGEELRLRWSDLTTLAAEAPGKGDGVVPPAVEAAARRFRRAARRMAWPDVAARTAATALARPCPPGADPTAWAELGRVDPEDGASATEALARRCSSLDADLIARDVPRSWGLLSQGQTQSLDRVLRALAATSRASGSSGAGGYTQGMNFVAAYLLFGTRTEARGLAKGTALRLSAAFVHVLCPSYHNEALSGLLVDCEVAERVLKQLVPRLCPLLSATAIDAMFLAPKLLPALGIAEVPKETAAALWHAAAAAVASGLWSPQEAQARIGLGLVTAVAAEVGVILAALARRQAAAGGADAAAAAAAAPAVSSPPDGSPAEGEDLEHQVELMEEGMQAVEEVRRQGALRGAGEVDEEDEEGGGEETGAGLALADRALVWAARLDLRDVGTHRAFLSAAGYEQRRREAEERRQSRTEARRQQAAVLSDVQELCAALRWCIVWGSSSSSHSTTNSGNGDNGSACTSPAATHLSEDGRRHLAHATALMGRVLGTLEKEWHARGGPDAAYAGAEAQRPPWRPPAALVALRRLPFRRIAVWEGSAQADTGRRRIMRVLHRDEDRARAGTGDRGPRSRVGQAIIGRIGAALGVSGRRSSRADADSAHDGSSSSSGEGEGEGGSGFGATQNPPERSEVLDSSPFFAAASLRLRAALLRACADRSENGGEGGVVGTRPSLGAAIRDAACALDAAAAAGSAAAAAARAIVRGHCRGRSPPLHLVCAAEADLLLQRASAEVAHWGLAQGPLAPLWSRAAGSHRRVHEQLSLILRGRADPDGSEDLAAAVAAAAANAANADAATARDSRPGALDGCVLLTQRDADDLRAAAQRGSAFAPSRASTRIRRRLEALCHRVACLCRLVKTVDAACARKVASEVTSANERQERAVARSLDLIEAAKEAGSREASAHGVQWAMQAFRLALTVDGEARAQLACTAASTVCSLRMGSVR